MAANMQGGHPMQHNETPHYHGFCSSCHHPSSQCCCHRNCRKIDKELLVQSVARKGKTSAALKDAKAGVDQSVLSLMQLVTASNTMSMTEKSADGVATASLLDMQALTTGQASTAIDTAVIGGGCCVHLSVEYMPLSPLMKDPSFSAAVVLDSQGTVLVWGKLFSDGGHQVKECIISTNPGAFLRVISVNSVTRVRWCEITSC